MLEGFSVFINNAEKNASTLTNSVDVMLLFHFVCFNKRTEIKKKLIS